ncbi:MAG TPA: lysylphosphatidylglycerol synthase domain-containing protein [Mycobacteriales bacterium]
MPGTPPGDADEVVAAGTGRRSGPRARALEAARIALVVAVLGFLLLALVNRWSEVRGQLALVDAWAVAVAFALVVAAAGASMLAWRALLADLGSPLPTRAAARVLFLGQLAKYLPGSSVWAVLAQTELARDYQVPRKRAASAALVFNLMTLGVAVLVAVLAIPRLVSDDAPSWLHWSPAIVPLGLLCLCPPVLNRLLALLFRALRRPPPDTRFSWAGVGRAAGWLAVTWLLYGLQVLVLAVDLGGSASALLLPSIGAFAAAWAAGFLVVVIPTGGGTREVVLTLALSGQLAGGQAAAITIAVISRLLLTVADVALALLGAALRPRRSEH